MSFILWWGGVEGGVGGICPPWKLVTPLLPLRVLPLYMYTVIRKLPITILHLFFLLFTSALCAGGGHPLMHPPLTPASCSFLHLPRPLCVDYHPMNLVFPGDVHECKSIILVRKCSHIPSVEAYISTCKCFLGSIPQTP